MKFFIEEQFVEILIPTYYFSRMQQMFRVSAIDEISNEIGLNEIELW